MLKHYLKTAIRNLLRNWRYSLINIFGLAIGIAATLFISLWIIDEYNYDRFHANAKSSYLIYKTYNKMGDIEVNQSTPYVLAPELKKRLPEVISFLRKSYHRSIISVGDKKINESRICVTDTNFFTFFDYTFLSGNPSEALLSPESVVITRSTALRYFDNIDVIGKRMTFENGNIYTISAVIEDMPANTHIQENLFVRIETIHQGSIVTDWTDQYFNTYIRLEEDMPIESFNKKATSIMRENLEESTVSLKGLAVSDLHLKRLDNKKGRIQYIYLFAAIGFLLIIIACINYINIYTSISFNRSHEIGLKKVVGASRRQVFSQFMGESFLQTLASLLLGISLMEILRPVFNNLTDKSLLIPYGSPWFIFTILGLLLFTTILAGGYPALLISGSKPADVFRGKSVLGNDITSFRKILVIFQFSISIGLIIVTLLINSQIKYIINKDMGFCKEGVLYIPLNAAINKSFDSFSDRLGENPNIISFSRASSLPSDVQSLWRGLSWEGREETEELSAFGLLTADHNLIRTIDLRLKEGRFFSDEFRTDSAAYVINQCAADYMGMDEPIGKLFNTDSDPGPIIGVVENFNSLSLNYDYEPVVIVLEPDYYRVLLVRISGNRISETISHIESVWDEFVDNTPFNSSFLDEQIEQSYENTSRFGDLSSAFTILAVIITCIGLFGMASYTVHERKKEIKIRKVMGASVNSVMIQFIKSFISWVLIANLIAWPAGYLVSTNWLKSFAFKAPINIWIFILSSAIAVIIAILSVSVQAYSASVTNPSEGLGTQ